MQTIMSDGFPVRTFEFHSSRTMVNVIQRHGQARVPNFHKLQRKLAAGRRRYRPDECADEMKDEY